MWRPSEPGHRSEQEMLTHVLEVHRRPYRTPSRYLTTTGESDLAQAPWNWRRSEAQSSVSRHMVWVSGCDSSMRSLRVVFRSSSKSPPMTTRTLAECSNRQGFIIPGPCDHFYWADVSPSRMPCTSPTLPCERRARLFRHTKKSCRGTSLRYAFLARSFPIYLACFGR